MSENTEAGSTGRGVDHREFLVEWFWHEGKNLNERTDWFLIFHALLIEAYLAASDGKWSMSHRYPGIEIGLFGLLTSFFWIAIGVRQERAIVFFRECLRQPSVVGPELAHLMSSVMQLRSEARYWVSWARSIPMFSKWVPWSCFTVWVVLVLRSQTKFSGLTVMAVAALVLIVGRFLSRGEPEFKQTDLLRVVPPSTIQSTVRKTGETITKS